MQFLGHIFWTIVYWSYILYLVRFFWMRVLSTEATFLIRKLIRKCNTLCSFIFVYRLNIVYKSVKSISRKNCWSFNSVIQMNDAVHCHLEFFQNTLNPSVLPSYTLILRTGTPVMLLKILNTPKLCDETKLHIKAL